jgi:hypothetical protein
MLKTVLPFSITFIIGSLLGGWMNPLDFHLHGSMTREACHRRVNHSKTWVVIHSLGENTSRRINIYRNGTAGYDPDCALVKVHVLLGADGEVARVYPAETYVDGATDDAISAAEQIRFTPATRDGVPVSVWLDVMYCGSQGVHERTAKTVDGEEWLVLDE